MKKVVYKVEKVRREGNVSTTGLGYIVENDLITANISKKGKPYIKIFEDCVSKCRKVHSSSNEYKGEIQEIIEIEVETTNSTGQSTGYELKEIEITYKIWFKELD